MVTGRGVQALGWGGPIQEKDDAPVLENIMRKINDAINFRPGGTLQGPLDPFPPSTEDKELLHLCRVMGDSGTIATGVGMTPTRWIRDGIAQSACQAFVVEPNF